MRKLKFVSLHTGLFFPYDLGQLDGQLPPTNKTIPGFEMYLVEGGAVQLNWKSKTGKPQSGIIGAANVKLAVFDDESNV